MRFVSALASAVWIGFLAWRSLRSEASSLRRVYAWALVFSAFSTPLIAYAQECPAYSLGTMFTAIIAAMLIERLLGSSDSRDFPSGGELVAMALACHTHYNALIFVALILIGYGILAIRGRRWREVARLALVPLACVPWVALNAHTVFFTWHGGVAWHEIGIGEALFSAFHAAADLLGRPLTVILLVAPALALALRVAGRSKMEPRIIATLIALSVFSIMYISAVAFVTKRAGMMHPRFFLFLLPAVHVGAGLLMSSVFKDRRASIALAILFAIGSFSDIRDFYALEREGYREAIRWARCCRDACLMASRAVSLMDITL